MINENRIYSVIEITHDKFYQLPQVFFTKHSKYEKLSLQAAVAYSFLKDRLNYSIQNNWYDSKGHIFFIFTNEELRETLKVKSKTTVVKIKKELEEFGLLEQVRTGVNKPNRLYLLRPEVTAQDVYELNNVSKSSKNKGQSLEPQGSPKNGFPENKGQSLEPQGSPKNGLPENKGQSLEPQGSPKNGHNQDKDYLDTNKIQEDTQLDFSPSKYSPEQIALQNADLKTHLTDIMNAKANTKFISEAALGVIKAWCTTPAEIERVIRIILNARNATIKEMANQGFSEQTTLLSLEGENLQHEVTTWLRSYFNKIRVSEHDPKKRIQNAENYLYRTMINGFNTFAHTQLQAAEQSNDVSLK